MNEEIKLNIGETNLIPFSTIREKDYLEQLLENMGLSEDHSIDENHDSVVVTKNVIDEKTGEVYAKPVAIVQSIPIVMFSIYFSKTETRRTTLDSWHAVKHSFQTSPAQPILTVIKGSPLEDFVEKRLKEMQTHRMFIV